MDEPLVQIVTVADDGDERGYSFTLPDVWNRFLGALADMHVTTIRPGHTRGNHYHARHREILVVIYEDTWAFHWDSGAGTTVERRNFHGKGSAVIEIRPSASHAVVNTGSRSLVVMGMSDARYNPASPDAYPRPVA